MPLESSLLERRRQYIFPQKVLLYQEPLELTRAQGSWAYDAQGEAYLDALGGIVTISVGHNHPRIKARLYQLLEEDAIQHTSTIYLSKPAAELAEKLVARTPGNLDQCYFVNSGSEANEIAVLLARVTTGQSIVVALRHAYHGGTSQTLGLCGNQNWKFKENPQQGVVHARAPYCYRCPFEKKPESCNLECAADVKEVIETTTAGAIAGMIVEPILGVGGFIDPPTAYHKAIHKIVHDYGGKYISDEVQTGVGRTGQNFFAITDAGVEPDIVTAAKGLGNGAPIGLVMANKKDSAKLADKVYFSTFGGDPFQTAQACEVLDIIEDEGLIANAHEQGKRLKAALKDMQKDFPQIGDVRGRGLLLGLELVEDPLSKKPAQGLTDQVLNAAKTERLLIGKGGLYGNVLRLAPSMAMTAGEVDEVAERLRRAFAAVC